MTSSQRAEPLQDPPAIVAVIPARGGSKGLRGKNLRVVHGVDLVTRSVRVALAAPSVTRVIVTTDSDAIAGVAVRAGAEVPFRRPAHLATDAAATEPVIVHAVERLEADGATVSMVVTLQPTSPLRTTDEVEAAVALVRGGFDSATTLAPLGHAVSTLRLVHGEEAVAVWPGQPLTGRRQDLPTLHRLTGSVYVTARELLRSGVLLGGRVGAVVVDPRRALDIDDEDDLRRARRLARRLESGPQGRDARA